MREKLRDLLKKGPRELALDVLAKVLSVGHPTNASGNNRSMR
jgi:hypothetical protein